MEIIEKNAILFLEFSSKIGVFSRELSTAHSENSEIKRINKDMKLILYSPGIWVIHSRRTYSQYDRNAKQTNDNL